MEFTCVFSFSSLSFTIFFGSSGIKPSIHLANLFITDLVLSQILPNVDLETKGLGRSIGVSITGTGASIKLLLTVSVTLLLYLSGMRLETNRRRSTTWVSHCSDRF